MSFYRYLNGSQRLHGHNKETNRSHWLEDPLGAVEKGLNHFRAHRLRATAAASSHTQEDILKLYETPLGLAVPEASMDREC